MRFKELLLELQVLQLINPYQEDDTFKVLKEPSYIHMKLLLKTAKYNTLRGVLVDNEHFYWWDSAKALHDHVLDQLNLKKNSKYTARHLYLDDGSNFIIYDKSIICATLSGNITAGEAWQYQYIKDNFELKVDTSEIKRVILKSTIKPKDSG